MVEASGGGSAKGKTGMKKVVDGRKASWTPARKKAHATRLKQIWASRHNKEQADGWAAEFKESSRSWVAEPKAIHLTKRQRELKEARDAGHIEGYKLCMNQYQSDLKSAIDADNKEALKLKRAMVDRVGQLIDVVVRMANILVGEDFGGVGGLLRHVETPRDMNTATSSASAGLADRYNPTYISEVLRRG